MVDATSITSGDPPVCSEMREHLLFLIVGGKIVRVAGLHDGVDKPLSCEERRDWFKIDDVRPSNQLMVYHLDEILWRASGIECDSYVRVGVLEHGSEKWSQRNG